MYTVLVLTLFPLDRLIDHSIHSIDHSLPLHLTVKSVDICSVPTMFLNNSTGFEEIKFLLAAVSIILHFLFLDEDNIICETSFFKKGFFLNSL